MSANLHVVASNHPFALRSGRRTAKEPLIKRVPLRLAGGLDVPKKKQAVRKGVRPSPVAYPARKKPKARRKGAGATEGVDDGRDGNLTGVAHKDGVYSSSLKIVKLLEEEMTCPRFTGFLGGMSQAKRKTATPTSPRSTDAIGARLLTTREVLGYDGRQQASYANQAGIAPNRYNQWERGHVRINLDGAMQLCLRYGLTLDWIYFGDRSCLPSRIAEKLPPETL